VAVDANNTYHPLVRELVNPPALALGHGLFLF